MALFVCVAEVVGIAALVCFTELRRGGGENEGENEEGRSKELRGKTHGEGQWWYYGSVCGGGNVRCEEQDDRAVELIYTVHYLNFDIYRLVRVRETVLGSTSCLFDALAFW